MNFVTINFELNDGSISKTLIEEEKAIKFLTEVNKHTKAWISID